MDMASAREKMVRQIAGDIKDRRVLDVMGRIPRELFVPLASQHVAYENMPLPIEMGQTISQPLIVGLMTDALELEGHEKVLEIGTGSGYQTVILAELAGRVVSVERHRKLADRAREVLALLDIKNVEIHLAEKTLGWRREAPYDAIIVTAGAPNVAQELLDQLAVEGTLVIPVGTPFEQDLVKVVRHKQGPETINLGPCRFVPLIGKDAWEKE
jgi:protein-L-isoaspartate(D-aspartate) O-methyltransferase